MPRRRRQIPLEEALSRRVSRLHPRLVGAAVLGLALLVGVAVVLTWRQYDDAKRQAARELRSRAVLAATVFDTYFTGQLATLSSIAAAPPLRSGDPAATSAYLRRVQRGTGKLFTGGIGWLDRQGIPRASSRPQSGARPSLASRLYFRRVTTTGKPFVSEAVVTRTGSRVIVMAVPTRDARGRVTGVLAGALALAPARPSQKALDLGYAGLEVLDRRNQRLTLASLAPPANVALVHVLREHPQGVLTGAHGLDGSGGRVVAYATSVVPGWKLVIDQPASTVFASARRSLAVELGSIAAAALLVLALIAWGLRASRREVRAERAVVRRWAGTTRALGRAADADEVCTVLAQAVAAEFPHGLAVVSVDRRGVRGQALAAVGRGRRCRLPEASADDVLPFVELAQRARSTARTDLRPDTLGGPRAPLAAAVRAFHGAALTGGREPVGGLAVLFGTGRSLDGAERALVQAYADQAGQALARIRRHEQDHETAITLQRSLLPEALPDIDDVAVSARYQAGGADVEIGGDWYDVVRRRDGIIHLTVGDVAGRGIRAAVLMGQLRNAFRAYAHEHASPAAIVRRLARHVGHDRMATTTCVTIDPYAREVVYASAGHPPPLLVDRDTGAVSRLDLGGSPPLGWDAADTLADEHAIVPANALLVLYTDGLVERRDADIDEEIDALGATLAAGDSADVERAADAVLAGATAQGSRDDAALLVVGLGAVPASAEIEIPGRPEVLADLRRRLRSWMILRGLDERDRHDALLVVSEACNNAIEHAYRDTADGTIAVRLEHREGALHIAVQDEGNWRQPVLDPTRGRGLVIMRNLMHDAQVVQTPHGTRVVLEQRLSSPTGQPAGNL